MGRLFDALEKAEKERTLKQRQEDVVETPTNSTVPATNFSKDLVVIHKPGSVIAEEFRFLRSRIIRPLKGDPPKTILITSCLQGEGKSFVSSNLAATIAKGLDEYVLLVDADLRKPTIHKIYGLDNAKKGLSTHLLTGEPLEKVLCKTSIEKLTILPAGEDCSIPSELLSSRKMKALVKELRDRYPDRYVIFDSSPIELTPETFVLAKEVDAVYLIIRRAKTPREIAKNTVEKFEKEKFKGVILNGYEKIRKYYKGYNYHYENSY